LRKYLHLHSVARLGGFWATNPTPRCSIGLVLAYRLAQSALTTPLRQLRSCSALQPSRPYAVRAGQGSGKPVRHTNSACRPSWTSSVNAPATPFCEAVYSSTDPWDERSGAWIRVTEKLCTSTYSAYITSTVSLPIRVQALRLQMLLTRLQTIDKRSGAYGWGLQRSYSTTLCNNRPFQLHGSGVYNSWHSSTISVCFKIL